MASTSPGLSSPIMLKMKRFILVSTSEVKVVIVGPGLILCKAEFPMPVFLSIHRLLRGMVLVFTMVTLPALAQSAVWSEALNGEHRSDANKARDAYRHPSETLDFFGITPTSTVLEMYPGGGWYTEVLA